MSFRILVAVITVFERVGDIFISWMPMYGEAKLALFIYMWYPKTKGCGYIYESIVRPYISKHEPDIDRSLQELRARGIDFVIYYWANFSKIAQTKFFEIIQFVASQSANIARPKSEDADVNLRGIATSSTLPPSPPATPSAHFKKNLRQLSENSRQSSRKIGRPPVPPSSPTAHRVVAQSPRTKTQVQLEDIATRMDEDNNQTLNDMVDQNGVDHNLHSPSLKKRSKSSLNQ
ncbi:membrane traffic protein [Lithospermum erythrorhizon]|uniref:HVA22-like protein n=1 Tax=Lithospermum erythrorhizon TaxID=34254 RepID=A0AAV3RA22_LITER